jgi:hypothetical protein
MSEDETIVTDEVVEDTPTVDVPEIDTTLEV